MDASHFAFELAFGWQVVFSKNVKEIGFYAVHLKVGCTTWDRVNLSRIKGT